MEAILISIEKKSDAVLMLSLAKKLGMKAKTLSKAELSDWKLGRKIEEGLKTPKVSRNEVMKVLDQGLLNTEDHSCKTLKRSRISA